MNIEQAKKRMNELKTMLTVNRMAGLKADRALQSELLSLQAHYSTDINEQQAATRKLLRGTRNKR